MFRVTCSKCQSRLNAKDNLLGQTRPCPKCQEPLLLQPSPDDASSTPESEATTTPPVEHPIDHLPAPQRLNPSNKYLICSRDKILATWESNGQGWQVKDGAGFASAKRNPDLLPNQGNFVLIELVVATTDDAHHLRGLRLFQLAEHWALPALAKGDQPILQKITGLGTLTRERKVATLSHVRGRYMQEFFAQAQPVLDFLTDTNYHAHEAGEVVVDEA